MKAGRTSGGGLTETSCTTSMRTPAPYSSSAFWTISFTSWAMLDCSLVRIAWMLRRPITSRIALSEIALMVPSGFWRLNTKSEAFSGLTRHCTSKSRSTMFSSPVSIRLSSGTSRVRPWPFGPARKPIWIEFWEPTSGFTTPPIG